VSISAQRLRESKDLEGAKKKKKREHLKKKELKSCWQGEQAPSWEYSLWNWDITWESEACYYPGHHTWEQLCAELVRDCTRKMKIREEPGYNAPVLERFTRTVSLLTAVLQPNSALAICWAHSFKKIAHKKCFKCFGKGISTHKVQCCYALVVILSCSRDMRPKVRVGR